MKENVTVLWLKALYLLHFWLFFFLFSTLLVLHCDLVEEPFLVVVRDSIIYGISLNPDDKTNDAMVPVAGMQNGYDVDFDDNEQTIYWVEHPVTILSAIHLLSRYMFGAVKHWLHCHSLHRSQFEEWQ